MGEETGVISVILSSQEIASPMSTLIIHLVNNISLSALPRVSLQTDPSHPMLPSFFPVKAKTQLKKFLLLNSVSSPVALGPLVRAERKEKITKHAHFLCKLLV